MATTPCFQVDAFTARAFRGNPAAVCLLDKSRPAKWMQDVAAEMNLSETAFLRRTADPGRWGLRWFTPAAEVELCGHATLAAAHALWRECGSTAHALHFDTVHSGTLTCTRDADQIAMDFPAQRCDPREAPAGLLDTLGLDRAAVRGVHFGPYDWIVELDHADRVRDLRPDFTGLLAFECRGVAVTAAADAGSGHDIVSRFFAPAHRIEEDPVTGSLHCVLATLWADRLGRTDLVAEQASRRGGVLHLALLGDRVRIAGRAVTTVRGTLVV